ncbi:MAG: DNA internalization-related competence protein ComEC/Rec2 [Desulfomonile tiedjei]|nr:DNA internalization-related competence protein ComEC/Rec2 [Desulfomonile tiedjei]
MFISEDRWQSLIAATSRIAGSYPSTVAVVCLSGGIYAAKESALSDGPWPLYGLGLALVILLPALNRRRVLLLWCSVAMFFFFLGIRLCAQDLNFGSDFAPPASKCSVYATVSSTIGTGPEFRILLVSDGYNDTERSPLPGYGRLFLRQNPITLSAGDRIAFRTRVRKPTNRMNPGEFDWEIYCKQDGTSWLASVAGPDSVLLVKRGSRLNPHAVLFEARQSMSQFIDAHSGLYLRHFVPEESLADVRAIVKGVVLGDLAEVSYQVRKDFADSGLAHTLAASGLNVGIVVLLVLTLVRLLCRCMPEILLRLPQTKLLALVSLPVVAAYCMLVGARVPIIRATIMGSVIAAGMIFEKRWASFNNLALAGLITLLIYPLSLFTASFQLSFGAVAGIFLGVVPAMRLLQKGQAERLNAWHIEGDLTRPQRFLHKTGYAIAATLLTSLMSTVALAPILLDHFRYLPVYTLPANLAGCSLMAPALGFGLLSGIIGFVWPSLGSLVLFAADALVYGMIKVAEFFTRLPWSTFQTGSLDRLEWLFVWGIVVSFFWFVGNPSRRSLLGLSLAAVSCVGVVFFSPGSWAKDAALKVTFLNVGKADAALVQPRGSQGVLVDGGLANDYFDTGRSVILPFLRWNGTRGLAGMMISHPDMDHMGGLLSVIPEVLPRQIWWNPVEPSPPYVEHILAEAARAGASIARADRACEPVTLGTATMRFLNPRRDQELHAGSSNEMNDASVVCRIQCGEVSFLFTGDMTRGAEEELIATGIPLRARVLKVGHHGSRTSTSRGFLEAVQPEVAVISCDYPRVKGFPSLEVLERLQSAGTTIYWTGRDGAVTMETNGKTLVVKCGRTAERQGGSATADEEP